MKASLTDPITFYSDALHLDIQVMCCHIISVKRTIFPCKATSNRFKKQNIKQL